MSSLPSSRPASTVPSPRLEQLCDKALARLRHAEDLLRLIAVRDSRMWSAAEELLGLCKLISYDGEVLSVPVEDIFAELEDLKQATE
jgi:hypothetical protein